MLDLWRKKRMVRGNEVALTLIDLMVVICVIGVVAALAIPLHANAQVPVSSRPRPTRGCSPPPSRGTPPTWVSSRQP